MKTALILIDIQNDYFSGGKWELPEMEAAAENAKQLLADFRASFNPIFHIQHIAKEANAPFFLAGTKGVEIHPSVQPQNNEAVIVKHFPNSFLQTTLLGGLQSAGTKSLVICGAMSNMCIDATTRAAKDFGFDCVVAHDACAAQNFEFQGQEIPAQQVHGSFMAALAFAYAKVVPTREATALR
ncbi:MAG: cysteine hydrolase family protein [Cyanobacteriota bacterium]|nr:cysteine hydrolase family protein [Cyanobacteriota bacterium]